MYLRLSLAASLLALGGCTDSPPAAQPVAPPPATAGPIPSGRPADTSAQFDRDPCSVATGDELGLALSAPFKNVSGAPLRQDGKPKPVEAGCDFGFIADGTDTAEAFHFVRVHLRKADDGAQQLSACRAAAQKAPLGQVNIAGGDEACLRPYSILVVRTGALHFTVTVAAQPSRASRADEDIELAAVAKAAATTIAPRLPRA